MSSQQDNQIYFMALGGIGEIGMNCYLYGAGPKGKGAFDQIKWIMVDLGITFPGPSEPGIDAILPDMSFIETLGDRFLGIILTHGHEDHYGAIPDLVEFIDVPIFTTNFTGQMLEAKLAYNDAPAGLKIKRVKSGKPFKLGPFEIEMVSMAHSIPEAQALFIKAVGKKLLHTGDWKLDPDPICGPPTDEKRLKEIGKEGVDVLICDSTNANKGGISISEADVAKALYEQMNDSANRVLVTSFSSNIARVKSIAKAAQKCGRHIVLAGRALQRNVQVAKETKYIENQFPFLSEDDFAHLPRDKTCVILTGSQGEPRAALARIADQSHPRLKLSKGDRVIFSSRTIPGNEKSVGKIINGLSKLGIEIITEKQAPVHVTGHPRQNELKRLYDWIKPDILIPMHGEEMHLNAQKAFAKSCGIKTVLRPDNGELVTFDGKDPLIEPIDIGYGRCFKDGLFLVADNDLVRARRKLGWGGHAAISVVLDEDYELFQQPKLSLLGMPGQDIEKDADILEAINMAINGALKSMPKSRLKETDKVQEAIRRSVRSEINEIWGKKPIVTIHLTQL